MLRDYGVQTDVEDAAITRNRCRRTHHRHNVASSDGVGGAVKRRNRIELRRAAASEAWDDRGEWNSAYHNTYRYYRQGDTVRYQNKHWKATEENSDSVFDPEKWDECLVHTEEEFAAEDYFKNVKPIITFDKDQDTTGEDPYLGYDPTDCFKDDEQVVAQHRTSVDYLGLYSFLRGLGFNDNRAHRILLPKPAAEQDINPNSHTTASLPPVERLTLGTTGQSNCAVPATSVCSVTPLSGPVSSTTPRHCLSTSAT